MRIVYLASSTVPSRTANSIHVMKMCQAFSTQGHEVTLIVPGRTDNMEITAQDPYEYYGVQRCFEIVKRPWVRLKGRGYFFGFLAALETRRRRPDLVYGRNLAGCYFAALMGLPVIFESHYPSEDEGRIQHGMFSRLMANRRLRKLVVITEALKGHYAKQLANLDVRIQVLADGADPLDPGTEPVSFPGPTDRLKVGYVGHLYKGRGIELLLQVARRLPEIDFHFVGGRESDIRHWQAEATGARNVIFHGFVAPALADAYRLACDVLVAPYQSNVGVDGLGDHNTVRWMSPLKLFEYMAAGKAIVASDLPALREVVQHGQHALLCPCDDAGAWAEALKMLQSSPEMRHRLARQAKQEFEEKYSWTSRAASILA